MRRVNCATGTVRHGLNTPRATTSTGRHLSNRRTALLTVERDKQGRSLNVKLAKNGLGDGRYLEEFRHENPDLGRRLDRALASASRPACKSPRSPSHSFQPPRKPEAPKGNCMNGYSPCLPVVPDVDCGEIGHPVEVTGSDPYRLDADGDGTGCD